MKAGPPSATNEEEALLQAKAYRKVGLLWCVFMYVGGFMEPGRTTKKTPSRSINHTHNNPAHANTKPRRPTNQPHPNPPLHTQPQN